jgi:hypothetical protein
MDCCARVRRSECHCGLCHQTFGTLTLFDGHQDRDYSQPPVRPLIICRDPALMRVDDHGRVVRGQDGLSLAKDPNGTWHTPAGFAARELRRDRAASRVLRRRGT